MRKLIAALSISAVTLAASTLWLRGELAEERASRASAPPVDPISTTLPPPSAKSQEAIASPADRTAPTPLPPPSPSPPPVQTGPPGIEQQRKSSREFLDAIASPEVRERMLAEGRRTLLATYQRLAESVGLSPAELRDFIDLQANLNMEFGETMARCVLDPGCDSMGMAPLVSAEARQRRAAFLGEERHARFLAYEDSLGERRAVAQLRGNLPESAYLSEQSSERLISALAAERRRYQAEHSTPLTGPDGFGTTDGTIFYVRGDGASESLESAQAYVKRLHAQAGPILSTRQLAEFDEMQRRLLEGLRGHLAEQETLAARGK
jgi:hypothetical protein